MPIRVKFTPDGREAWVTNARSNAVVVFDVTRAPVASFEAGNIPIGIQLSPDGGRAFIANTNDDRIVVFDVPARRRVGSFEPGREPDGMAWVGGA